MLIPPHHMTPAWCIWIDGGTLRPDYYLFSVIVVIYFLSWFLLYFPLVEKFSFAKNWYRPWTWTKMRYSVGELQNKKKMMVKERKTIYKVNKAISTQRLKTKLNTTLKICIKCKIPLHQFLVHFFFLEKIERFRSFSSLSFSIRCCL